MSHETIYQSLFIQGKGALRKELWRCSRLRRVGVHARQRDHDPVVVRSGWLSERAPRHSLRLWLRRRIRRRHRFIGTAFAAVT